MIGFKVKRNLSVMPNREVVIFRLSGSFEIKDFTFEISDTDCKLVLTVDKDKLTIPLNFFYGLLSKYVASSYNASTGLYQFNFRDISVEDFFEAKIVNTGSDKITISRAMIYIESE